VSSTLHRHGIEGKPAAAAISIRRSHLENGLLPKEIELDIFKLGAGLECTIANSLEVFVEDDALEGGAFDEHRCFEDFELIGESDTREGTAVLECSRSYFRNVTVSTEYHFHEMLTASERKLRNALKFRQS